eukprot:4505628-Pleurochrysis_carterae.AAC.1
MPPAAFAAGACAVECIASPFARRHSSHAMLRAILVHSVGASRLHWGRSRNTSARRWLNLACNNSAVICSPLAGSRFPCVTSAGDGSVLVAAVGMISTPALISGTV